MEKKIFKKLFVEIGVVFLLTSLTLSLIIWILQAVNFLDIISEDGHSIATYFKFSLLNLPKIFSKILLLSFFLSLFYVLVSYDEKNQLLIYWSNGISKKKFLSKIFFFSLILVSFSFFLSFVIVPFAQDKARSFIRSSSLDFFPALIKPKQFIDTVENLTIFINKKENDRIENLILKDTSNANNIQLIIAKDGKIINENDNKYLFLYNGKIINSASKKKSTIFNFNETRFNLDKYKTKTTTTPKIQELNSFEIIDCLINLKNSKSLMKFDNFKCNNSIEKNLSQELYTRAYLPFYISLISIIVTFLILNSHNQHNYKKTKLITFLFGILFIILSQISVNFISEKTFFNYLIILVLPITIIISIYLFNIKTKFSS
jgi:lipopolysaccharide export system permease protein